LEEIGVLAIGDLLKEIKTICEHRKILWRSRDTIMLDVFFKRERHIICKKIEEDDDLPSITNHGPVDTSDLLNQKHFERLEKLLPVLNGLVY